MHKVPARVTGGTVTPRWVRFQVLPALGAKISKIKRLSEELAAALDAPSCRVSRRGAAITIEVPRDDPQPVRLLPLYKQLTAENPDFLSSTARPAIPPITAILGLAEDGTPLLIRLPSPDVAHVLVAGTTGSGKTVLLQTMILSLAMSNPISHRAPPYITATPNWKDGLALILIDPKGHAFSPFEGLPHLARPVIRDTKEAIEALHSLLRLMDSHRNPSPRIVLFIDELADLLMTGGKTVQFALTRLTQRGREAGIHIVAATQKPITAVLGPLVKANFPVRLVGRVTSIEDARTATGWSGTGAERLLGRGDFLAVAEGRVVHFQVAHVSADEIKAEVQRVTPARNPPASIFTRPSVTIARSSPLLPQNERANHNHILAKRLIDSALWENRRNGKKYQWGFLTKVCNLLFDQPLAGTYDQQTRQAIALAEAIAATTTTTATAPGEGPQGGAIPGRK
jgi:S-DNA-T family DNA segregation ATPase FtsK/SpoIIIE